MLTDMNSILVRDAILRVGQVSGIEGRKVFISVDKNKNSSDLLLDGEIVKNVSVGSYVEIRKGFLSIIGKADGEKLTEEIHLKKTDDNKLQQVDKNSRILTLSLVGYIGFDGKFIGGIKELPLIGNEAFVLTEQKIHSIHNLKQGEASLHVRIAKTEAEEIQIDLPVDGIFNSHVAVFGNTGSGKSNTVAALYQGLFETCGQKRTFLENCRFLIFDFNGEYTKEDCITTQKRIYNLKTQDDTGDKIQLTSAEMFDNETLSVLVEATEKTQKPFLVRALRLFWFVKQTEHPASYLRTIVQNKIRDVLNMANKDVAFRLLDYLEEILGSFLNETAIEKLRADIEFHNQSTAFFVAGTGKGNIPYRFFNSEPDAFRETNLYQAAQSIDSEGLAELSDLTQFYIFLHLQLIDDLYKYKVQNDHIYPVINRFRSKQRSIERTFRVDDGITFWGENNCTVINLQSVNLDMRKTIPLLLAKNLYNAHKTEQNNKSLNIIVDEAHNILSKTSFRETEEWKDYRLETFEEIIKEGRKFGVFLTIASQRPNDISETIISQAHNYFIHQLINQRDLLTIGSAVSYIDKLTEESIPTLPVGTCIFSGIATPMPLKLKIAELPEHHKPQSQTLTFKKLLLGGCDDAPAFPLGSSEVQTTEAEEFLDDDDIPF